MRELEMKTNVKDRNRGNDITMS